MSINKRLVGSAFAFAFLTAGLSNAATAAATTTTSAAPVKSGRCFSAGEKISQFANGIVSLCAAASTAQSGIAEAAGGSVNKTSAIVLATCAAVGAAKTAFGGTGLFGPRALAFVVDGTTAGASGRTILSGSRAFYVDEAVGTPSVTVTLARGATGKAGKERPSKGSGSLRVCATQTASSVADLKARQDSLCDCWTVPLGKDVAKDVSTSLTIDTTLVPDIATRKLFIVVGSKGSLAFNLKVEKPEATPAEAAPATPAPTSVAK